MMKVDDTLGVFSTHGVAGLTGGLLVGMAGMVVDEAVVVGDFGSDGRVGDGVLAGLACCGVAMLDATKRLTSTDSSVAK